MKKITLLLSLLLMATGAGARVITTTPVADTPYKIKCIATDHTGNLADDGSTLQGRAAEGTFFVLESTGTEGQYYLKSEVTGKYINAAGNASGDAVTFDTEHTTYWTLDQTNANTGLNSWTIRPNGTADVSLNNNNTTEGANAACPWMKINGHNSNTQGCNLWTFDDGEVALYGQPKFGGTVWTWNTSTNKFDAEGQTSTGAPGRLDNKGPVYKFVNVGTVTTAANTATDTSDQGGIWVIGTASNVTSTIGRWAGSVLVESGSASVSYSTSLKGTEADADATVWANGTLAITGRTNFDMNDGGGQRWYIGENGVVNTSFTQVTKGNRTWDIQVVVADQPVVRTDVERVRTTLTKKVMTWGSDISGQINSIAAFYKDADGNLTQLGNTAVHYDATGITIEYEGLGYDEKVPSLPQGKYISVSSVKADFLTPATGADDNAHWYVMTQTRGGVSPVYDNGNNRMHRAAANFTPDGQLIAGNEKYLVRFFENGEGKYDIQFATGRFVNHNLTTGTYVQGGAFNLYKINDESTHIGWNKPDMADIVDNDGTGANLSYWGSGTVTRLDGNNDWSLSLVEFVDGVTVDYTIHSEVLGVDYTGSYVASWDGDNTALPTLAGAAGYTLTDVVFAESEGHHTLTAKITFPFPVSGAAVENATGIESALSNSKWYATADDKAKANSAATTTLNYTNQNQFKWYIYPTFADGAFSFKIKNANGKYIPVVPANYASNECTLTDEASAGSYYFIPCVGNGNGFSNTQDGPVFLSINSTGANQNIYGWSRPAGAGHQGSNLTFPDVTVTQEELMNRFAELKAATPFDILEGSTVAGPSEFAAPEEINTAIAAANEVDETSITAVEAFLATEGAAKISNYLDQLANYGELHTHHIVVDKVYSTIMLPCPSVRPDGLVIYSISAAAGNQLTQTSERAFVQNTPYVMESTVGSKFTIIGWLKEHPESTYTNGLLTGVYAEGGVSVPAGSYVLGEDSERQAFVKVLGTTRSVESATCGQYECYLTPAEGTEAQDAYFFANPGTTVIDEISAEEGRGADVIFDLQGRRVSKAAKGVYIINGKKVLVK